MRELTASHSWPLPLKSWPLLRSDLLSPRTALCPARSAVRPLAARAPHRSARASEPSLAQHEWILLSVDPGNVSRRPDDAEQRHAEPKRRRVERVQVGLVGGNVAKESVQAATGRTRSARRACAARGRGRECRERERTRRTARPGGTCFGPGHQKNHGECSSGTAAAPGRRKTWRCRSARRRTRMPIQVKLRVSRSVRRSSTGSFDQGLNKVRRSEVCEK